MDYINIIGLTAAAMSGIALFPQVLKVLRTKSTKDISREMIDTGGYPFFMAHLRILISDMPLIIANFFGLIQSLIILFFKIKNQIKRMAPCKE